MARGSESEGSADGEEAEVQAQQSHKHQHLRQKLQRAQHLMRREASGISSQHSDSSAPPAAVVAGPGSSSAGTGVELAAQCVVQQAAAEASMRLALPGSLASSLAVAPVSVADFQALASTTDVRHLTCILAALSGEGRTFSHSHCLYLWLPQATLPDIVRLSHRACSHSQAE
jgi:hypothetical protein